MLQSDARILVLGNNPKGVCRLLRWAGYRNTSTGSILAAAPKELAEEANPFEHSGELSLALALRFKPNSVILHGIPLEVIWDIILRLREHDETKGVEILVATPGLTTTGKQKLFESGCVALYSDKFEMIRALSALSR
jgi:hypothetical protein